MKSACAEQSRWGNRSFLKMFNLDARNDEAVFVCDLLLVCMLAVCMPLLTHSVQLIPKYTHSTIS